ncbi:MAG: DUF1573 domain-containing protein [Bacteroidota bacterium]
MIWLFLFVPACVHSAGKLPCLPADGRQAQVGDSRMSGVDSIPPDSDISWLDPLEIDFGTIPQDSAVTATFRFQNQTDSALIIDNVRTSCGCTASDWEVTPTPTGEIGKVSLTFDAAKRGYFKKRATVWFRGVKRPARITLSGLVR